MKLNIFLQEYFKIIQYLYWLKDELNIFSGTTRIEWWKSNGNSEVNIKNLTKSHSNFAPTFVIIIYYQV